MTRQLIEFWKKLQRIAQEQGALSIVKLICLILVCSQTVLYRHEYGYVKKTISYCLCEPVLVSWLFVSNEISGASFVSMATPPVISTVTSPLWLLLCLSLSLFSSSSVVYVLPAHLPCFPLIFPSASPTSLSDSQCFYQRDRATIHLYCVVSCVLGSSWRNNRKYQLYIQMSRNKVCTATHRTK